MTKAYRVSCLFDRVVRRFCLSLQHRIVSFPAKHLILLKIFRVKPLKKADSMKNNQRTALNKQQKARKHRVHGLYRIF